MVNSSWTPGLGEAFIPPRLPRAAFPELRSPRLHAWHLLALVGRVLYPHRLIGSMCSNLGLKHPKEELSSTKGLDSSQNSRTAFPNGGILGAFLSSLFMISLCSPGWH